MGTASGEEASARRTLGDEVLQVVASERWAKSEFSLFDIWISHSSKIEMLKAMHGLVYKEIRIQSGKRTESKTPEGVKVERGPG